jgi:hypothetical protein
VAMRAARAAWQAKLVPALWEAWGAVANILGALREYEAERQVLAAILPQVRSFIWSGDLLTRKLLGRRIWGLWPLCTALFVAGGRIHGPRRPRGDQQGWPHSCCLASSAPSCKTCRTSYGS